MANILPFQRVKPVPVETAATDRELITHFGIDERLLKDALRPLFALMHEHGLSNVSIERNSKQALLSIDGKQLLMVPRK